jgi:hypothetical protein
LSVDRLASISRSRTPSKAMMPLLISRMARCCGVASRSSTIAVTRPSPSRMIRPSPSGLGGSAVSTVAALPPSWCSRSSASRVSGRSSGVSPVNTTTVPVASGAASSATRVACPVPCCTACSTASASGATSPRCAVTRSAWTPTTTSVRSAFNGSAAASTCPTRLRPNTGCSTFGNADFIRLPSPAASTITVQDWSARSLTVLP